MVHCEFENTYKSDRADADFYYDPSIESRLSNSYIQNNWTQMAETTLPLKASKMAAANQSFQASVELKSRQLLSRLISVNLVSLLVNLALAIVAFYFSFVNDSTATTAFAADCLLDFISSGIVLWRYYGDLSSICMHAREQIACIYLGALFEISAFAIIIKASSDMLTRKSLENQVDSAGSKELVILSLVATVACCFMTIFKCSLYKTIRDNSILLDVINTLISTIFAISIVMSQALINFEPNFWYLDPILSIVLALFMVGFGIKVIHENFNILRPVYCQYPQSISSRFQDKSYQSYDPSSSSLINQLTSNNGQNGASSLNERKTGNYGSNLNSQDCNVNWQKADFNSITFK